MTIAILSSAMLLCVLYICNHCYSPTCISKGAPLQGISQSSGNAGGVAPICTQHTAGFTGETHLGGCGGGGNVCVVGGGNGCVDAGNRKSTTQECYTSVLHNSPTQHSYIHLLQP